MRHPQRISRQVPALALGAFAFAACVPTGGKDVPAGAASLPCIGTTCIPTFSGAPVTTAPAVDCEANELGLEFAPIVVLDNESTSSSSPSGFTSNYFYQYVDGTADIEPQGYTPPAIAQQVCTSDVVHNITNHVLHASGGPFTGWGGGIGIGLAHFILDANRCPGAGVCPFEGGFTTNTPCLCPNPGTGVEGQVVSSLALDVSQWDGISFWARRGPNGQPLMRVLVGDKFTDDDISYKMYLNDKTVPRFCERKAECTCLFQDATCDWYSFSDPQYSGEFGTAPTPDVYLPASLQSGGFYCGPPGSHPGSASASFGGSAGNTSGANNYCDRTLCDRPYAAYPNDPGDPQFNGRACTPYTYRNGTIADVCYNPSPWVDSTGAMQPADPLPPEADEQCGDHFTFPVNLSTEWQFYAIPFTEMQQQGWAKQAPYFDLTSASVVRFTWDVGYIDYYIDNVRFYRVAHPTADAGADASH